MATSNPSGRTPKEGKEPTVPDDAPVPTAPKQPAAPPVVDPPGPGTELVLVPPAAVEAVTSEQARTVVPVEPDAVERLAATARSFADNLVALDVHSGEFASKVGAITSMGDREVRETSAVSNRMLERPVRAMGAGGLFDSGAPIGKSLIDLRNTVEKLDPAKQGDLFSPRRLLGVIPLGSRLRDYFDGYRSSQAHLNAILDALYHGQDELRRDNAAIEQEKVNLWAAMGRLQQYALMAERLDAALEARIGELEAAQPDKARVLREDVLFYVRQKHQDLLTQLAVAIQGYLALDLVRKNNLELVKGVDRATTTTVAALRTAVMVAQALANQRLVLDQITALNTTTGNLIESTAAMLRRQTAEIHDQAASATINLAQLKAAFDNIYATMDAIDTFKVSALRNMRSTVETLQGEIGRAQQYLERAAGSPQVTGAAPGDELTLPGASGR
jgi:uncharacterized protein YaaN involved in tellurite resistance